MGHIFLLSSINHKYNIIKRNVTLITNSQYLFNLSVLLSVYYHQQSLMFNISILLYYHQQKSFFINKSCLISQYSLFQQQVLFHQQKSYVYFLSIPNFTNKSPMFNFTVSNNFPQQSPMLYF